MTARKQATGRPGQRPKPSRLSQQLEGNAKPGQPTTSPAITDAWFHSYQAMERTWLLMAMISTALSEHPTIREDRTNRHFADRARKALFDLHTRLETHVTALQSNRKGV